MSNASFKAKAWLFAFPVCSTALQPALRDARLVVNCEGKHSTRSDSSMIACPKVFRYGYTCLSSMGDYVYSLRNSESLLSSKMSGPMMRDTSLPCATQYR